jgi:hypothetical protein
VRRAAKDPDYADFWSEEEPAGGGRHARRSGCAWRVGLLVLLAGMVAVAVAVALIIDLLSSKSAASATTPAGPVEFSLGHYLNNVGVTSNSNPAIGNLDGSGSAFSLQALAARGVRPGAKITYHGVPFSWPDAAVGQADNVTASGQALMIHGAGSRLAFLVTAGWGPASGTGKVIYADGATQKFTITAPDWFDSCPSPAAVVDTPYRNQGSARASFTACLYYASVRLHASQVVKRIVLPDISAPRPLAGDPSLHIFAITIY